MSSDIILIPYISLLNLGLMQIIKTQWNKVNIRFILLYRGLKDSQKYR